KGTIALDADAHRVGAQRAASGHAVAALAADDVALGTNQLADVDGLDALAQRGNLTDELMTDDQALLDGGLRPFVPCVDVQVGTADACTEDADQHLARAGLWLGDIFEPQAGRGLRFDQRLHRKATQMRWTAGSVPVSVSADIQSTIAGNSCSKLPIDGDHVSSRRETESS